MRKWKVNENYFEKIDSDDKAYWLGFMCADGNVEHPKCCKNARRLKISLAWSDREILEKLKNKIGSDFKIRHEFHQGHSYSEMAVLEINSTKIASDIKKLGCIENKTLQLQFPTESQVPRKFQYAFIRGYFDGDGCVWEGKRYFKVFPSRPKGRTIHNVKFNITGYIPFISALQDVLVRDLKFKKTRLGLYASRTNAPVCTLEYSGRNNLKTFYNYIYKDASIFLERKKNKFEGIFCALLEKSRCETGLIAGNSEMTTSSQASNLEEGSSTIPEMEVESSDSKCPAPTSNVEGEDIVNSHIKSSVSHMAGN